MREKACGGGGGERERGGRERKREREREGMLLTSRYSIVWKSKRGFGLKKV